MKNRLLPGILAMFLCAFAIAPLMAQAPIKLYVSKQTNERTSHSGSYSKTTDQYEHGTVDISLTGPITDSIDPPSLSIGVNETKTWNGKVMPDPNAVPRAGATFPATLTANYDLNFSRPYGAGTSGTVSSTYMCAASGTSGDGCAYHNHNPGMHEIVNSTGTVDLPFEVISIMVDIADTICLGRTGQNSVMALSWPDNAGNFLWTSSSSVVQIMSPNQRTTMIKLLDTSVKNAIVKVRYEINGVTYTDQGVLSTCECSCKPITSGITAGPVSLSFNVNPVNPGPDGQGICRYDVNNASFNMKMIGNITRNLTVPGNAKVKFGKDCKTGNLTDVIVDWQGDISIPAVTFNTYLFAGQVTGFNLNVVQIHLQIATNGNLSGSVQVVVTNPVDRDLSGTNRFVILRKGTNTTVTFNFNNTNGWAGTWDWSGIQGINIDLVKKDGANEVVIANFNGNYTAAGLLSGNLSVVANAQYKTDHFTITMKQLVLGIEVDIGQASVALTSGSGKVVVSDMTAVTGTVELGLVFPAGGGCTATIGVSNMTAFSMTLNNLNLQVDFNKQFDMTRIQGSLKAQHTQFSAAIDIQSFVVVDGSLTEFTGSGDVKYQAFKFTLINTTYTASPLSLTISASVSLDASGTAASVTVTGFNIDANGAITVGSIAGNFNRGPAQFGFSATFGNSRFQGTFNGQLASIGLSGAIDVGAMSSPDYNFAYFNIAVQANVMLGQTGLKLTTIGGEAGFNYQLNFPPGGLGTPTQGNYVVGLTIGVADVANICNVLGNCVIQINLGTNNVVMTINGTLKVLATNEFFGGGVTVNYRIPQNVIDGQISATVKIPNSGFIVSTNNCMMNFNIGNNQWAANGSGMSGQMFNGIIQLNNGNINMNGLLSSPAAMSGTLGGDATATFNFGLNAGAWGNTISGNIGLNLNSSISANINENGLNGSFGVHVTGSGQVVFNTFIYSDTYTVNGDANGQIGYNGGVLSLWGTVTVTLPVTLPIFGNTITQSINLAI